MDRRRFLKLTATAGAGLLLGAGSGGALWLRGTPAPVAGFATITDARAWLQRVATMPEAHSLTAWPLAQVFEHCAQSVEFSLHGFPQPKPAWFQGSAGALAFAAFNRAGAMRHGTTEPIPGAPALVETSLVAAVAQLDGVLAAFTVHAGPLQPHFAYGALDKAQYTRAHLMHLAEHAADVAGVA